MVKVDLRDEPGEIVQVGFHLEAIHVSGIPSSQIQALGFVRHQGGIHHPSRIIHAPAKPPAKKVDPHNAEDEPEDQAHEEHVADGWNGLYQRVHHHLEGKMEK